MNAIKLREAICEAGLTIDDEASDSTGFAVHDPRTGNGHWIASPTDLHDWIPCPYDDADDSYEFPAHTISVSPLPANPHGVAPEKIRAVVEQANRSYPNSDSGPLAELTSMIAKIGHPYTAYCTYYGPECEMMIRFDAKYGTWSAWQAG